jgi:hypothetical protein
MAATTRSRERRYRRPPLPAQSPSRPDREMRRALMSLRGSQLDRDARHLVIEAAVRHLLGPGLIGHLVGRDADEINDLLLEAGVGGGHTPTRP